MKLKPVIASYPGRSYDAIRRFLDGKVLGVVARVAESPVHSMELDAGIPDELIEMHVFGWDSPLSPVALDAACCRRYPTSAGERGRPGVLG